MNFLSVTRQLSFVTSASAAFLYENPREFLFKLERRLRIAERVGHIGADGESVVRKLLEKVNRKQDYGFYEDELECLLRCTGLKRWRARRRIRFLTEELKILRTPIEDSPQLSNTVPESVLFFLTNSLPFTKSGYTIRSQSTIEALLGRIRCITAVTRYGYPLVVGRFADNFSSKVGEVSYSRIIPPFYSLSKQRQIDYTVKCICKLAKAQKAQLLHTTTDFKNAIPVSIAARSLGIPWVYEVRGELEATWLSKRPVDSQELCRQSDFFKLAQAAETRAMNAAAAVIVLSEVSKRSMVARGVDPGKIHVVPNAIDTKDLDRASDTGMLRSRLGLAGKRVIGTVSSLVPYEGFDLVIQSMLDLPEDICFLVVGEGEDKARLQALARELGVSNRVIFHNAVPSQEAWKWYALIDVFVVPRRNTDVCRRVTPLKPVLAQALGIPVMASDLPALREVCAGNGYFFTAESEDSFKDVLMEIFDGATPLEQRDNGIRWARERSWQSNAARILGIYSSRGT